ncbi:hypothetical protein PRZ48_012233 [Zasmidium cellare]|uniref:Secreted protein n=1 Tax=Zasmidium cellare TaxID=395010 RepID=A0ABR0E4Q5_ZASCE|nr:hypothetical protein PRZ48_012233 [Zasmidium cellare]
MKLLAFLMRVTTTLHRKVSVAIAPKTFKAQAKGQEKPCLMDSVRARRQEKANRERRSFQSLGRALNRRDTQGTDSTGFSTSRVAADGMAMTIRERRGSFQ